MQQQPSAADQQLLDAAKKGDRDQAAKAISQGASLEARHAATHCTALQLAAQHGHVDVVRLLGNSRCDINAVVSDGGVNALHLAAEKRHLAVAQVLLEGGAMQTTTANGAAPLHSAAKHGDMDMLELLIDHGADIAALHGPTQAPTPLGIACVSGHMPAAARLMEAGAGVNSTCSRGITPLHGAATSGKLALVRMLLRAGASVNAVNGRGFTPLLCACQRGYAEIVRELLDCGAQPGLQPGAVAHVLVIAAANKRTGIVRMLLGLPGVQALVNVPASNGVTALIAAAESGVHDIVSMLLAAGSDVHARTPAGRTALFAATREKHLPVVQQLLAAGADPVAAITNGGTALHHAAVSGNLPMLQELLAAVAAGQGGGSVDPVVVGMTPLHMAVHMGHTSCIQPLMAAGADPNRLYGEEATDDSGNSISGTPLHWAVQRGHTAAVPLLATPHNVRYVWRGQTALHVALAAGQAEMAQALVTAGSPVGVADTAGATATSLAAGSGDAALRALLAAMVRSECEWYKQLQQGVADQQRRQQQDNEDGGEGQQGPAAVLAAVATAVSTLLEVTAAIKGVAASGTHEQGVACFTAAMEVCGRASASTVLQTIMERCSAVNAPAAGSSLAMQLLRVLHSGWSGALEPLLQARREVLFRRLQELVLQPMQSREQLQQLQEEAVAGAGAAAGSNNQQAPAEQLLGGELCHYISSQVQAAAVAGQWQMFVRLLEKLTGRDPGQASNLLYQVAAAQGEGWSPGLAGLCEGLLGAWWAGRQAAAARAAQERVGAVVGAVNAATTQPHAESGRRGR
jgi:ankyrin repeat protein